MRIIFILLFVCTLSISYSQDIGRSYMQFYPSTVYKGEAQCWTAVQDNRGVMYFGLTYNLIEYDGNEWRKIDIVNSEVVRSLKKDANGRIYAGLYSNFGYLAPNEQGEMSFKSLKPKIDSAHHDFSDVWFINIVNDNVYFGSYEYIFVYNVKNDEINIVKTEGSVYSFYGIDDRLFQANDSGFYEIKHNKSNLLAKNKEFKYYSISGLAKYTEKQHLALSYRHGLLLFNPDNENKDSVFQLIKKQNKLFEINEIIKQKQPYKILKLSNNNYAIATIVGGVYIINCNGNILKRYTKKDGLLSETIYNLYEDRNNGLWLCTESGITRIELADPVTIFNEKDKLEGSPYDLIKNNDILYCGTNLGTFYLENNQFVPVKDVTGNNAMQCFTLKNIKSENDTVYDLYATVNGRIIQIDKQKVEPVAQLEAYEFIQSKYDKNIIYTTNGNCIVLLKRNNKKWSIKDTIYKSTSIPFGLIETDKNTIWSIVSEKPLKISLKNGKFYKDKYYNDVTELSDINIWEIREIDNKIVLLSSKGLYQYVDSLDRFKYFAEAYNGLFNNNRHRFESADLYSDNLHAILTDQESANYIYLARRLNNRWYVSDKKFRLFQNYEYFGFENDSILWGLGTKDLYRFNLNTEQRNTEPPKVLIRKVYIRNDSVIFKGTNYYVKNNKYYVGNVQNDKSKKIIDYKNNDIIFYFTLPYYTKEKKTQYSYKLIGNSKYEEWAGWSEETKKEFTNLREGKYVFKIRAKNIYGEISEITNFKFEIEAPWYRTFMAYTVYTVLFALFLWGLVRVNTYRLKKDKEKLERIVEERTIEIREKNVVLTQQKEEIQAQAENLQDANNEITEKNAVLSQQKEEIQAQAENLRETNDLLVEKNEEILQQKAEIQAQAENLQLANDKITKINTDIRTKNKKITDSIQYAQRIQKALLPADNVLKEIFPQYFIVFHPRDIVSGDFYWAKKICYNEEKILLIAVADCTGHGVPGAFMSVLGISFLNEIIKHSDITSPKEVLNELRDQIKLALKQTEARNDSKDGMDMSFCEINLNRRKLVYSGANNPIYILRKINDTAELIEFKPDRMPIGIYINERESFTNHEFDINEDDIVYMFTDGYPDQRGGTKGRKFMHKIFKQKILEVQDKTMTEQRLELEKTLHHWMYGYKNEPYAQIDDILVVAFKINFKND